MARDNSPRERQKKQLERKLGRRAGYDRILIVSEGSKTEPNYFREIRAAYRLHTANVEVRPSELGTAPIQVKDGERYDQAETTLFAQYAQGWRLVSSLVHTEGYTGEKTMVPHTFFLERPKN
jgi:hypothetical protein